MWCVTPHNMQLSLVDMHIRALARSKVKLHEDNFMWQHY